MKATATSAHKTRIRPPMAWSLLVFVSPPARVFSLSLYGFCDFCLKFSYDGCCGKNSGQRE